LGGTNIWFADDFDQWRSGAVEIDIGGVIIGFAGNVGIFGGIFFEMGASDADTFLINLKPAMFGDWKMELRNLITFWKVGVEIVFAIEDGGVWNRAAQSESGFGAEFDGFGVQGWERARLAGTDGADRAVWCGTVINIGATAKHF